MRKRRPFCSQGSRWRSPLSPMAITLKKWRQLFRFGDFPITLLKFEYLHLNDISKLIILFLSHVSGPIIVHGLSVSIRQELIGSNNPGLRQCFYCLIGGNQYLFNDCINL